MPGRLPCRGELEAEVALTLRRNDEGGFIAQKTRDGAEVLSVPTDAFTGSERETKNVKRFARN